MHFVTNSLMKGSKDIKGFKKIKGINGNKGLKKIFFAISFMTTLMFSQLTLAQGAPNTILYDTSGAGVAYIEAANGTMVVYNVAGDPLAYVAENGAVFTFSGKQIGWYNAGVVYDMNGYQLAFPETLAPQTVVIKKVQNTEEPVYKPLPPLPNKTVVTETNTTTVTRPAFTQQVLPNGFSSVFTITPAQ